VGGGARVRSDGIPFCARVRSAKAMPFVGRVQLYIPGRSRRCNVGLIELRKQQFFWQSVQYLQRSGKRHAGQFGRARADFIRHAYGSKLSAQYTLVSCLVRPLILMLTGEIDL
jgi:hypothetical protein